MADELEKELRNLPHKHLTDSELIAYCEEGLAPVRRARMEAHLKQCFMCEIELTSLREDIAAVSDRRRTAEDEALVDRMMEKMGIAQSPRTAPREEASWRDRLAEYLRQMVENWQRQFAREAVRSGTVRRKKVWQWQSEDGKLQARAFREKNGDLSIHFSTDDPKSEGTRLRIRLGSRSYRTTLKRVSDTEIAAEIVVPWQQLPQKLNKISMAISTEPL